MAELSDLVAVGASPTGFEGLTSSNGEFLSTAGPDLGAGPRSVSGVGVGAGATRRGREDCGRATMAPAKIKTTANRSKWHAHLARGLTGEMPAPPFPGLGNRFFIGRILSDFGQNLQTKWRTFRLHAVTSGRARGDIRMRRADRRFAIRYGKADLSLRSWILVETKFLMMAEPLGCEASH